MKIPYEEIVRVCNIAEPIARDNFNEEDYIAVQKVQSWLLTWARRSRDDTVKRLNKRKEKKFITKMDTLRKELAENGIPPTSFTTGPTNAVDTMVVKTWGHMEAKHNAKMKTKKRKAKK